MNANQNDEVSRHGCSSGQAMEETMCSNTASETRFASAPIQVPNEIYPNIIGRLLLGKSNND